MIDQRNDKEHHRGKQRRSSSQTVQAIDEIECIGDRNHPQNRERQVDKPGQRVGKDHRQIENPHSAGEKHGPGKRLHSKLQIGTGTAEVVIDAETKNQTSGDIDAEKHLWRVSVEQTWEYERESQPQAQSDREREKNSDAPQSGQRRLMDMPSIRGRRNPAAAVRHVSHLTRRCERDAQREGKQRKKQNGQNQSPPWAETFRISAGRRSPDVSVNCFRTGFPHLSSAVSNVRSLVSKTIQPVAENEQRLWEVFAINFDATTWEKRALGARFDARRVLDSCHASILETGYAGA